MKPSYLVIASVTAALSVGACTSTGNTERGAVGGAALGGLAGAVIGNNAGSGDAATGAAIGAIAGGVGGAVVGNQQDKTKAATQNQTQGQVNRGPNGEELTYDRQANRYYYYDSRRGRTYWENGDYRS